jgi:hypothetical protein
MAERFLVIENMLTAEGYICTTTTHPSMSNFITLRSKNGNILFGLGIFEDRLAIVRFSALDGNGPTAYLSILADVSRIIAAIELLAKGAQNATNINAHVNVA